MAETASSLKSGQVVKLTDGRSATIRYVGNPAFATGEWIGLELATGTGKNDGEVQGERYFECPPNYGMFVRPTAIKSIISDSDAGLSEAPLENGRRASTRPTSAVVSGLRRQSVMDRGTKRQSTDAPSPSGDRRSGLSRSPIKSPTKLPGTSISERSALRSMPAATRPRASMAPHSQTGPPSTAGARPARMSLAERAGSTRTLNSAASPTRRMTASRQSVTPSFAPRAPRPPPAATARGLTSEGSLQSRFDGVQTFKTRPSAEDDSSPETPSGHIDEPSAEQPDLFGIAQPELPHTPIALNAAQRSVNPRVNTPVDQREVEELKRKMRMVERKRSEDREKLKTLDRVQAERDKYEAIIQKLQAKIQPQHQELVSLRKQLSEATAQMETLEPQQAQHEYLVEMATLDREMAEENAEMLRTEVEALQQRQEEIQLEYDVLQAENQELGHGPDAEERSSHSWIQMEREKDRLREALLRLRDMTQAREAELKAQVRSLEEDMRELTGLQQRYDTTRERMLVSEAQVEDLRQQLDAALGAEAMIEELTAKNVELDDRLEQVMEANQDLEGLQQINDEIELDHVEYEKQMQQELDDKDSLLVKHARLAKEQADIIEENEFTMTRYKEIVKTLQSELEDIRASHQILGAEADETSSRSRAMLDVNMKLQASARKSQATHLDIELRKLEAQEAMELLAIVQLFLPEGYNDGQNSISAYLRVRRVGFKAQLLQDSVKETIIGRVSIGVQDEDAFAGYEVLDRLVWLSAISDRFTHNIRGASVEKFRKFEVALYDLEPVERALTGWIDNLRNDEFKERQCASELKRIVALMTHLAEVHLTEDLKSFADQTTMRIVQMQSHLSNTTAALTRIKNLVETHTVYDDDQDCDHQSHPFGAQISALISQTRSTCVLVDKSYRSLSELHDRSLTLPLPTSPQIDSPLSTTTLLLDHTLEVGLSLSRLISEEGRTTPLTYTDITSTILLSLSTLSPLPTAPLSPLTDLLSTLHPQLSILLNLTTDLSTTTEFLPSTTTPWQSLATDLQAAAHQASKSTAETRHLRHDLHELATQIALRDKDKDEMAVQIELLQARMADTTQHTLRLTDLESRLIDAQARETSLRATLDTARTDLHRVEAERDRNGRPPAATQTGTSAADLLAATPMAGDGTEGVSSVTTHELARLRREIENLHAAVRFLREERRAMTAREMEKDVFLAPLPMVGGQKMEGRRARVGLRRDEYGAALRVLVKTVEGAEALGLENGEEKEEEEEVKWHHQRYGKGRRSRWRPRRETTMAKMDHVHGDWNRWTDWVGDLIRAEEVY